jgi:hypothetical protein
MLKQSIFHSILPIFALEGIAEVCIFDVWHCHDLSNAAAQTLLNTA